MELRYKHNKKIVANAKELRKNMTKEERHLWYDYLRNYPVRVLRQKIIGDYIVDFCCTSAKLVIELDGSQHYDEEMEKDPDDGINMGLYNYPILISNLF